MTASVPSLPARSPGISYPTLSLTSGVHLLSTEPSASTASIPSICARVFPYRTMRVPPALVATMPPSVADSFDAKSIPKRRPCADAARSARATVTPAPAAIVRPMGSTASIVSRRLVLSTTDPAEAIPPPTSPVLPPCGVMGTPASKHARRTADTSEVLPGRMTAIASPIQRPVQSRV